ncbi:hypothetical protein ACRALDRAFT_1093467 [Sodiomyces alcalophilus JCM 7366]|uniref:uncharacterized protein n=1 Tax=Sodiomyces alcalophilus JCM 7366 TaxID=591952 RepID=UPI0039B5C653
MTADLPEFKPTQVLLPSQKRPISVRLWLDYIHMGLKPIPQRAGSLGLQSSFSSILTTYFVPSSLAPPFPHLAIPPADDTYLNRQTNIRKLAKTVPDPCPSKRHAVLYAVRCPSHVSHIPRNRGPPYSHLHSLLIDIYIHDDPDQAPKLRTRLAFSLEAWDAYLLVLWELTSLNTNTLHDPHRKSISIFPEDRDVTRACRPSPLRQSPTKYTYPTCKNEIKWKNGQDLFSLKNTRVIKFVIRSARSGNRVHSHPIRYHPSHPNRSLRTAHPMWERILLSRYLAKCPLWPESPSSLRRRR